MVDDVVASDQIRDRGNQRSARRTRSQGIRRNATVGNRVPEEPCGAGPLYESCDQCADAKHGRKIENWLNHFVEFRAAPPFRILRKDGLHVPDSQPGTVGVGVIRPRSSSSFVVGRIGFAPEMPVKSKPGAVSLARSWSDLDGWPHVKWDFIKRNLILVGTGPRDRGHPTNKFVPRRSEDPALPP